MTCCLRPRSVSTKGKESPLLREVEEVDRSADARRYGYSSTNVSGKHSHLPVSCLKCRCVWPQTRGTSSLHPRPLLETGSTPVRRGRRRGGPERPTGTTRGRRLDPSSREGGAIRRTHQRTECFEERPSSPPQGPVLLSSALFRQRRVVDETQPDTRGGGLSTTTVTRGFRTPSELILRATGPFLVG